MSDVPAARLCTSCGLCCDGSIYDHALLEPGEASAFAQAGGRLDEARGGEAFHLPCALLGAAGCTIYDVRPGICRKYSCAVLTGLTAGEIPIDDALDKVVVAKRLAAAVNVYLLPGETIAGARRAWLAWNRGEFPEFARHLQPIEIQRFHLAMLALNRYLDRHFRKPHQALTVELDSPAPPPARVAGARL